jgi:hypothetical protein
LNQKKLTSQYSDIPKNFEDLAIITPISECKPINEEENENEEDDQEEEYGYI